MAKRPSSSSSQPNYSDLISLFMKAKPWKKVVALVVLGALLAGYFYWDSKQVDEAYNPSFDIKIPMDPTFLNADGSYNVPMLTDVLDKAVGPGNAPDYDRDLFEPRDDWYDVDGNGCDTRNDVLHRDMLIKSYKDSKECVVATGTLNDPYSGESIPYVQGPGTSMDVQIDHLVPAAVAWRGGANAWTTSEREAFSNDPINLLAVKGFLNNDKKDKMAPDWTPPNSATHCDYAALTAQVLWKYDLELKQVNVTALKGMLQTC